jgi:hypothetical protein
MQLTIFIAELPKGGMFRAWLDDGTALCKATRQPLLDGARELLSAASTHRRGS